MSTYVHLGQSPPDPGRETVGPISFYETPDPKPPGQRQWYHYPPAPQYPAHPVSGPYRNPCSGSGPYPGPHETNCLEPDSRPSRQFSFPRRQLETAHAPPRAALRLGARRGHLPSARNRPAAFARAAPTRSARAARPAVRCFAPFPNALAVRGYPSPEHRRARPSGAAWEWGIFYFPNFCPNPRAGRELEPARPPT